MIVKIQNRRGQYVDFDPSKLLPGEFAIVQTGDPNTSDGKSIYICVTAGNVKQIATLDELQSEIETALQSAIPEFVQEATQEAQDAADRAEAAAQTLEIDTTLTETGQAAEAKATGDAIDELNERIDDIVPGLSEDAKTALLACFQHIAFLDNDDDYYTNLRNALYASDELVSITATFSQGSTIIYPDEPLDNLRTMLVVTGLYADGNTKVINDYRLSGTLVGDTLSVITVSYRDKTTTFAVAVTEYEWGSDYTWLYRADKDGLLSSNSNISEVGAVSGNAPAVETNSGGVLNIKSEYDGTDHGSIFELIPHTSTNASIKLKARFNELPIGAEGSGLRVQVSNGTNGAQFYVMQRTSNAPKIFSRSNVSAVDIAKIELNKWYILECELSSGQQVITVDGTAYPVANLSSASNTKTRIIALEPSNAVSQNPGNLDFDIAWIAFKDNSN